MQYLHERNQLIQDQTLTMTNLQTVADKAAIGLSLTCAIHCLALPVLIAVLPALSATQLGDEAFHLWLLVAVVPASLLALTIGCRKHKRYRVVVMGVIGLVALVMTAWLGHDVLGAQWEKVFTVLASSVIALGHLWNHQLCRQINCPCD